ncbi:unnamed protein product [Schistocephalus solidus]|uniref:Reverse transcriptase domain-containing protein n=1 Tax=Schistocephalus solidus TaxID=70667 RepID=A0A183SBW0_SCHSO|nr:unnamed protein product [Schistocephalus solidus]
MPVLSTHLVRVNRPGRTSSDAMHQQSEFPNSASNSARPPSDYSTLNPGTNSIHPAIIATTSYFSSPVTSITAKSMTTIDGDSLLNCPQCDHTFSSRFGLVGQLGIPQTNFYFSGQYYQQLKGTPMGSTISGFLAKAVMQKLESIALPDVKPKFWLRYVVYKIPCSSCNAVYCGQPGNLSQPAYTDIS